MQEQQITAYAPHIGRQAIMEAYCQEPTYYRKDDLQLSRTADTEPWTPSSDLRSLVGDVEKIPIKFVDHDMDICDLRSRLLAAVNIGLVLMGPSIGRGSRPSLIVLTTRDTYYTIDPNDDRGIMFLKNCINEPKLTFWTTNGLHEADCLFHNYKIKLHGSQARCCLGLHLHLMKVISHMSETLFSGQTTLYPKKACILTRRPLRLERFERLVQIWLELTDTREIEFNRDQLDHLKTRPLNLTAMNIIRKRCSLVLTLAEVLVFHSELELLVMNRHVMSSLIESERAWGRRLKSYMKSQEAKQEPIPLYFTHLESVVSG